ncbi:uncharacterized protein N7500_010101 [Penicillium coprophilum]|uniref:uncharacterized protein n=1 Tax=Penicillium coprophilum TaxID=36646 RepID=UPI00239313B2|nr:uncharacterized protein N7500_010101 [Penicillium coprophilum]KAJ5154662.1 hypothetical protein N7500_010101 [Penicillium coprophilum]
MTHFLDRVRTVLRGGKRGCSMSTVPKASGWTRLPSHVFVAILASCELKDIGSLSLSCRALHDRVLKLEFAIAWAYIQLRKQMRHQSHYIHGTLIGVAHDNAGYSLGYLGDLKRCWNTCIRLSYHLADHVVEHHLETDPIAKVLWSSSKTEKEVVFSKAVASLQAKLLYPIAYAIFFLETSASPDSDSDNSLYHKMMKVASIERQQSILQNAPFDDMHVFLSTHHCMQLLFSTVQRLMGPEISHSTAESWVSLLLTTSTMERIVKFFVSIAKDDQRKQKGEHDSTWSHRKEFLWAMRRDLNDYMASFSDHGEQLTIEPKLNHVWFHAACKEMDRRGAIPHTVKDTEVHVLHGSVVKLECDYCYDCFDE